MQIITINLPNMYLDAIALLTRLGKYPSRSEAVRIALRDFLQNECKFKEELEPENLRMLLYSEKGRSMTA